MMSMNYIRLRRSLIVERGVFFCDEDTYEYIAITALQLTISEKLHPAPADAWIVVTDDPSIRCAGIAGYSIIAWMLVLSMLIEYSEEYLTTRTSSFNTITVCDDDWPGIIRAHGDEVVAQADGLMPRAFRRITRGEVRWILKTLGKHMA